METTIMENQMENTMENEMEVFSSQYGSFHFILHYPDITPIYIYHSRFHFLFHYPNVTREPPGGADIAPTHPRSPWRSRRARRACRCRCRCFRHGTVGVAFQFATRASYLGVGFRA